MSIKVSLGILSCLLLAPGAVSATQAQAQSLALTGSSRRETAVERAYDEFAASGTAPAIRPGHLGDYVQFAFGYGEAKVQCTRLHACPIELQAGERLLDEPLIGDAERWIVETSAAGRNGEVPLVIVKPTECNLTTNVLIPTDRRVYMLSLVSEACAKRGPETAAVQRTKFWYPDDIREAELARERVASAAPCDADATLNDAYDLKQRRGWFLGRNRPYVWTPERICDDGVRTYIQLPALARHAEMPVLYQIGEDGEKELLNYTVRGDVIVTDRVLVNAALVVNSGGKDRRIDIDNQAHLRGGRGGPNVRF